MEEELDLTGYFKIIKKRKKMIIALTLLFVLLAVTYSLIKPKTYESTAMIELGEINGNILIPSKELIEIIQSPIIIKPAMIKLQEEKKRTFFKNLDVLPISNKYLTIKLETYNIVEGKEIILVIIDELFEYTNKEFNKRQNMIMKEHNQSIMLANEEYYKTIESINKEIIERENNVNMFEQDIIKLESQAKSLHPSGLSEEGLAKSTLIISILNSYESRLLNEKNKLISLEKELINKKLAFDKFQTNKEIELEKMLINTKDFKIISGPDVFLKTKNMRSDLLKGLGVGLFVSVLLSFAAEWLKNID